LNRDWSSCASNRDDLSRAAADANSAAETVEARQDSLAKLPPMPDVYGLYGSAVARAHLDTEALSAIWKANSQTRKTACTM
jgi:hypothetical protein